MHLAQAASTELLFFRGFALTPPKLSQSIEPIDFLAQFHVKLNNMRQNIKK